MNNNKLNIVRKSEPNGIVYHDEYMNVDFALIPSGGNKTAHAPTITETSDGGFLCAWFAGSFEGSGDISIVVSKLDVETQIWSIPKIVSKGIDRSEQNPSFFRYSDNEIWLIYTSQVSRQEGKDNMQFTSIIMMQKSFDDGVTWSEPTVLFSEKGTFSRQTIQVLSNGRWIYSTWICKDSSTGLTNDPTEFKISDNQGLSWKTVMMPESYGRVHANVIEINNGHLVSFMRSRFADNIYKSESFDFGDSWSIPEATELPNNNSSISAIKLSTGEIALTYNRSSSNSPIFGTVSWPGLRNPIAVSVSEDAGKTWPIGRIIESAEGYFGAENKLNNAQYEYPTIFQDNNNMLHLVYTFKNRMCIKYVRFSIDDLYGQNRSTSTVYNPTSGEGIIK